MSLTLKVHGLEQVKAQLKELGAELSAKALRSAGRKAFAPVLAAAIARAPVANEKTGATGITRKSIRIATAIDTKEGAVHVGLVISKVSGKGKEGDPSWRWHFIERGTVHQSAKPFLRPALDANAQRVVDLLTPEIKKRIEKALKKKRTAAQGGVR